MLFCRLASVLSPNRLVLMIQRTQDLKGKKMSDIEQSWGTIPLKSHKIWNIILTSEFLSYTARGATCPKFFTWKIHLCPPSAVAILAVDATTDNPNSSVSFLHHQRRHLSLIISWRKPRGLAWVAIFNSLPLNWGLPDRASFPEPPLFFFIN